MPTPTFGGLACFGVSCTSHTDHRPRERQTNAFFGLSGLETLDGGARGLQTTVTGVLSGNGPSGLALAEGQLFSLKDGTARILTDTLGRIWFNVLLDSVRPTSPAKQSPSGVWFRSYEATFTHLTS